MITSFGTRIENLRASFQPVDECEFTRVPSFDSRGKVSGGCRLEAIKSVCVHSGESEGQSPQPLGGHRSENARSTQSGSVIGGSVEPSSSRWCSPDHLGLWPAGMR